MFLIDLQDDKELCVRIQINLVLPSLGKFCYILSQLNQTVLNEVTGLQSGACSLLSLTVTNASWISA